jgi:hypothetical protein
LAVVIVTGSIASLNVALTNLVKQLPMLASAGVIVVTVGAVVSVPAPVVKLHTWLPAPGKVAVLPAIELPAKSVAAVVIVTVNAELIANVPGAAGVNVAVLAEAE